MFKISGQVVNFIIRFLENWRVEFSAGEQTLAELRIQKDIIQKHSLLPLLYCNDATEFYNKKMQR